MSIFFRLKSAKDFESIPIEGQFISIGELKERIVKLKYFGRGSDYDLIISNAQTNEEYKEEGILVRRGTSVLLRRVPGHPSVPLALGPDIIVKAVGEIRHSIAPTQLSTMSNPTEESEWDDFGCDPLAIIPERQPAQSFNAPPVSFSDNIDEDSKIRALIETPALVFSSENDGYRGGRGHRRGMDGHGFARGGMLVHKTPPPGYVCHRCKVPGHLIQHCPTNGNPAYDVKRVKPPTGIPRSMLKPTSDGSYSLPNGALAVLHPDEAAFERAIEGIPSAAARAVTSHHLPQSLHCPICRDVMQYAVLTSKCCFITFCHNCIRDHLVSKSRCACGARGVLADSLIPNKAVRDTIIQLIESPATTSQDKASTLVQDSESAQLVQKVSSLAVACSSEATNASGVTSQRKRKLLDSETTSCKYPKSS